MLKYHGIHIKFYKFKPILPLICKVLCGYHGTAEAPKEDFIYPISGWDEAPKLTRQSDYIQKHKNYVQKHFLRFLFRTSITF